MTQSIIVQVGQCGNQIGYQFWDAALKEYQHVTKANENDTSFSSFFEVTPVSRRESCAGGTNKRPGIKARAVLIDMEEGVLNEVLNSKLGRIFNHTQQIRDVSGAGNNWAVGHLEYGNKYRDKISDVIRLTAESCDSLQCFFCMHSMGGGTGSGLGTFVLSVLKDEYPDVFRFVTAVYPSVNDDVITSPYNSVLAMYQLTEGADCVLPIENQALMQILQRAKAASTVKDKQSSAASDNNKEKAFERMNGIVANLILDLTSSSRFEGSLNVDLNEISMNLVPFPKIHYLTPSMTPIYSLSPTNFAPRLLNHMFNDVFSASNQLLQVDPVHSLYLGCSLMVRGDIEISDIRQNIDRLKPNLNFIHWNQEGWKVGLCHVAPLNKKSSLLALANNTCFQHPCLAIKSRFMKLFKRKAHLHHYTHVTGFEEEMFHEAVESLNCLVGEYKRLEESNAKSSSLTSFQRLRIA